MVADGYGRTLELKNDTLNPNQSSNWFAGCIGGSPGGPFIPCNEDVIFSEVNYSSAVTANAGDWVELYNNATSPIDISGWIFKDGDDTHQYIFPPNTILQTQGILVLVGDTLLFKNRFPSVTNYVGKFNFGLSNKGEAIRLFDNIGKLMQSIVYDETLPWPSGANGNGYTLELVNYNDNLCDGNNWQDGCPEGSPGVQFVSPCVFTNVRKKVLDSDKLSIYPNPSNGKFIILLDTEFNSSDATIDVYNYLGQSVFKDTFKVNNQIYYLDFTANESGIYLIRLNVGGEILEKTIIKE
jgi:hypothetical protein